MDGAPAEQSPALSEVEGYLEAVRQRTAASPIARLFGFRLTLDRPGVAVLQMDVDQRFANPMGTLHGGIMCDLADAAMGIAYVSQLQPGESFTTLELKINYLKPIWTATLTATGRVVRSGRTIGLVECDVVDQEGSLAARASSTCMTLRGEMAKCR
jgi:uncharacterized protein (TIGR00369 family)